MKRLTSWLVTNANRLTPVAKVLGPEHREHPARRWITFLSLAAVGTWIAWWRMPITTRSLLWAEDGRVFVADAMRDGGVSVFAPWAGYMHLVPRSVTWAVTRVVPLEHVPAALTLAACIMLGVLAAYLVDALRGHVPHAGLRLLPWAALVASPLAGVEVNGSIANTHWFLLAAVLAASIAPWERWPDSLLASAVLVLAIGSDPLALYVAPIVLIRVVGIRARTALVPALAALAATITQLAVVASTELAPHDAVGGVGPMVRAYLYRVVVGGAVGTTRATEAYERSSGTLLAAAAIFVAALIAGGLLLRGKGVTALAATGASIALFVASTLLRWKPVLDPGVNPHWPDSRYSVAPIVLLAIAIAVLLEGGLNKRRLRVASAVTGASLALLVGFATYGDLHVTARTGASRWDMNLAAAVVTCAATPAPETIAIPIAPSTWKITLPCDRITGNR
jgi:hypothetical protein